MTVREVRDRPNLLPRVDGPILRGLSDRDRARLHMVLVAEVVQMLPDAGDSDLSIRRRHRQQLASYVLLRRATLVHVHVRRLGADHCLMGLHHALQAEHIGGSPTEDEKNLGVLVELASNSANGFVGVWVLAVRW